MRGPWICPTRYSEAAPAITQPGIPRNVRAEEPIPRRRFIAQPLLLVFLFLLVFVLFLLVAALDVRRGFRFRRSCRHWLSLRLNRSRSRRQAPQRRRARTRVRRTLRLGLRCGSLP